MRKAFSRASIVGGAVVVMVVGLAIPAWAAITAPATGTVSGTVALTDDGKQSTSCDEALVTKAGTTQMYVDQGSGQTGLNQASGGAPASFLTGTVDSGSNTIFTLPISSAVGSLLANSPNPVPASGWTAGENNWVTDNWGNGTYTVNSIEQKSANNLFSCGSFSVSHPTVNVTVNNTGHIAFTGSSATTAPQGTNATVSAVVTDQNGFAAGNGQTVSFSLSGGSTVIGTIAGGAGVATVSLPINGPPGRAATVTATYGGSYFTPAATPATAFTITKAPSTITVSPTTPTQYGQNATFTATVASAAAGETAVPLGTVQFSEDGVAAGPAEPLSGGIATYTDPTLTPGNHAITATYSGDVNYLTSTTTASVNQSVATAPTSTSVVSSTPVPSSNPGSSSFGQSVFFTATVSATAAGPATGAPTGTVSFTAVPLAGGASINIGGAVTLSSPSGNTNSASSLPISLLSAGGYKVTATYTPTTNYAASSSFVGQTVNPAGTSVAVTSTLPSPPGSDFGQAVQFTAVVSTTSPGHGSPTGSVTFVEDPGPSQIALGTVNLNSAGGDASSATTAAFANLTPGFHTIVATYTNTDGNYVSGSMNSVFQFVAPDPTTTVISTVGATNPSLFGQPVQFQATVSPLFADGGTPVGNVSFFINASNPHTCNTGDAGYLATITLVNGVATTAPIASLPVGPNVISACYTSSSGPGDFGASTTSDPQYVQTVNSDPTTTALTSSNSPGLESGPTVFGQPVTFTAAVSANAPGAGIPLGTVTFSDGATPLQTVALSGNSGSDTASYETSSLTVGTHAITAVYNPANIDFLTSSTGMNQVVNQDPTTITVTQNSSSVQGQPVSFTATVTANAPGAGTPTGSVEFFVNGADIFGGPVTLTPGSPSTGSAATSAAISSLTPGMYTVTATYSGDVDFLTSSNTSNQSVDQATTSTALVASPSSASLVFGTPVSLTATVTATSPGVGLPTGSVDFYDGTTLLGAQTLSTVGAVQTAALPPTVYALGAHSFHAVYLGEFDYLGSTSNTVAQTVGLISTTTTLASSLNPSLFTQTVTLTATVTPSTNAGPGPGGTVTFRDGSTVIGTSPVALSGTHYVATLSGPFFSVGTHSVTASYSGSTDYTPSASATLSQVVNKDGTIVVAQASTNTTMTATLVTAQGAPIPGQTLSFTTGTNNTALCSAVTAANGVASCTATGLGALSLELNGTYKATFAGNASFLGSSGSAKG